MFERPQHIPIRFDLQAPSNPSHPFIAIELKNKKGASIEEVKDQIEAFTHDIEVIFRRPPYTKGKGEQK